MKKKGRALDARGARFETERCGAGDGRTRLCVAIDPDAPTYSLDNGRRQFRLPKGF